MKQNRTITIRMNHQDTVDWLEGDTALAERYNDILAQRLANDLRAEVEVVDALVVSPEISDSAAEYTPDGRLVAAESYEAIAADMSNDWSWVNEDIAQQLSREDCLAWHQGEVTPNVQKLLNIYGEFQVWGMPDPEPGEEPLRVIWTQ